MFYRTIFISTLFFTAISTSTLFAQNKVVDTTNAKLNSPVVEKNIKNTPDKITADTKKADIKEVLTNKEPTQNQHTEDIKKDTAKNTAKNEKIIKALSNKNKTYQAKALMLSTKEYLSLQKALTSLINKVEYTNDSPEFAEEGSEEEEEEQSERSYIYLASLLYFGQKNWVVWINDRKITSTENNPKNEFYIKNIQKNSVELVWKLGLTKWKIITGKTDDQLPEVNDDNQIVNSFKLRPNQTYVLADDDIIEGKMILRSGATSTDEENSEDAELDNLDDVDEFNFF